MPAETRQEALKHLKEELSEPLATPMPAETRQEALKHLKEELSEPSSAVVDQVAADELRRLKEELSKLRRLKEELSEPSSAVVELNRVATGLEDLRKRSHQRQKEFEEGLQGPLSRLRAIAAKTLR